MEYRDHVEDAKYVNRQVVLFQRVPTLIAGQIKNVLLVGVNGHALLFTLHGTYLIRSLCLFVPQLLFTNTEIVLLVYRL